MHLRISQRRCALLIAGLIMLPSAMAAMQDGIANMDRIVRNLPDLYSTEVHSPARLAVSRQSAGIRYETRNEKLDARLESFLDADPAVNVDYGRLLTSKLGAGGSFTRHAAESELVLNGIYAHKRNLRFRLSGAQRRASDGEPGTVLQNSYLFGVRKYWDNYEFLSDAGIATYAVEADAPLVDETEATDTPGKLNGYRLDLGFRPTPQSRIELRHDLGHRTEFLIGNDPRSRSLESNRIGYTQDFGGCIRLQGAYRSGDTDRLDLKLARQYWNIRLSRELENDGETSIHFGYRIPLGRHDLRSRHCGSAPDKAPSFEPIVDAAIRRPE